MYNHKKIEKKWQQIWKDSNAFYTDVTDFSKPKFYVLDMFPYPSGSGLHVGHLEGYTATDIVARFKRLNGFNVLHPMGWDSFGLPAEQYALNTGNHPATFTAANIENFKRQINAAGFSYDWSKEIATSTPEYYHWTQWIFAKMYDAGLAYVDELPVNWCEELGTVLANEEVIDGKSERGGYPVVRTLMRQWVLKITAYAEKLLADLDQVDWPQSTKEMQANWIGKSEGAHVIFKVADNPELEFTVFTTRADTLFGATYCVLAPEHPFVKRIVSSEQESVVLAYIEQVQKKSDLERTDLNKDKTGVFTGAYAVNPVNNKKIPIYIADYVLSSYGSGAIMAVPAHDQRDYDFAKKYSLEIIPVLEGGNLAVEAFTEDGVHINSGFLNGLGKEAAIEKMIAWLSEQGVGEKKTTYKLRDWLFSRQRYWGEPIPIVHLADGTMRSVPLEELPLQLPVVEDYKPGKLGTSPLGNNPDWLNIEVDGQKAVRETNTMPQWAGSCWYYMRYLDPHNNKVLADKQLLDHWLPVDLYVGGAEHAVLHLLYARFWHKFLYDIGVVSSLEPFKKLFHQGIILGNNGEKMSKSRGNVVNPDEIFESHGADTLRLYEMFMGPLEASLPWNDSGLDGIRKWLDRVWRLYTEYQDKMVEHNDGILDYVYNFTVKKVTNDIESLNLNTAISQMMIFVNECYKANSIPKSMLDNFLVMLSCFAPHIAYELAEMMAFEIQQWPTYDESKLILNELEIVVQVNGKLRGRFMASKDESQQVLSEKAMALENVVPHIAGKQIVKTIVVPNKLVNIVAK